MTAPMPGFPSDFVWGAATAAYQIEGAVDADDRGRSIWDTFSHTPGAVRNGDTGDVACDHYRRWPEDLDLLRGLGVGAYRFSIAWPRVQPTGTGAPHPAGLAFYDRLVDGLLERGIAPTATLYHWDLPQALEDRGGWGARDTAERFAEYAGQVVAALGDRVAHWITLNEPWVVTTFGHALGTHAPGRRLGRDVFPVAHHQLLGHGLAVRALRAAGARSVGVTLCLAPCHPATDSDADRAAARRRDAELNRMYTDPLLRGAYPDDVLDVVADTAALRDGDLAVIGAPLDFLGVNYYFAQRVGAGDGWLGTVDVPEPGRPVTGFGWPVHPEGFTELLVGLRESYGSALPPLLVTENGCAYPDAVAGDGGVPDGDRISYLDGHLRALRAAMDAGVDVRGYFCWSLLDNFEWAEGYAQRFGLVHVDFATQRRTPKDSYHWYAALIRR